MVAAPPCRPEVELTLTACSASLGDLLEHPQSAVPSPRLTIVASRWPCPDQRSPWTSTTPSPGIRGNGPSWARRTCPRPGPAVFTVGEMISRRYPHCITRFMRHRDLVDADYHLNGVGRAIAYTRIAAQQLRNIRGSEMADYHAYAGVSVARTAIDSMASWLNQWSGLNLPCLRRDGTRP
jgi:hypothetical protein